MTEIEERTLHDLLTTVTSHSPTLVPKQVPNWLTADTERIGPTEVDGRLPTDQSTRPLMV